MGLHYKVEDAHGHRCVNNPCKVGSPELVTCSAKGGKVERVIVRNKETRRRGGVSLQALSPKVKRAW